MASSTILSNGEILLYGDVGDPYGWGDGFSVTDVQSALVEHGPGDITVRINSGGGIAFDGVAIYSLLRSHEGSKHVIVDGIAASAASLILMAGDTREIRDGAMVMIHDAAGLTFGTAADHQRDATVLDKLSDQYAGIYATRSGLGREEVRTLMRAETWFTADEAVSKGLATSTTESHAAATASFNYRLYAHAPQGLPTRLKQPAATGPQVHAAVPEPVPTAPAGQDWARAFFSSAVNSRLSLEVLNEIVSRAPNLASAKDALIDMMAAAQPWKPGPAMGHLGAGSAPKVDHVSSIIETCRKTGMRMRER